MVIFLITICMVVKALEFLSISFPLTTEINNLKIDFDVFVIGETDSLSATSDLIYFSTLDSWKFNYIQWRNIVIHCYLYNIHNNISRDVQKVFGHCNFLLYISYKTTIFQNIITKSILVRFWWYFYQQKRERA